jgi:surface polysaccharide O-acyltransferase-like enzyme
MDPATSLKLRALSMVGILMVVVGHSPSYRDASAPSERSFGYAWTEFLLTDALPRVLVMVFFAVAGFLLLQGHDGSAATWRRKWVARSRSLLLPYLLWSAIGLCIYALLQALPWTADWFTNSSRRVLDRGPGELLLVWLVDPIPYQLWFLRDLYLMVLLSPLLQWLLRRFGMGVLAVLLVPYYLDAHVPSPVPGVRLLTSDGYWFFALGAAYAVRARLQCMSRRLVVALAAATLVLASVRAYGLAAHWPNDLVWWKTVHVVGVAAVWGGYDLWLRWLERPLWMGLSGLAFFVFVAHEPLMTMLRKPLTRALGTGDLRHALSCVGTLVGTVALVMAIGLVLRRWWPRSFAFLCGGRG